MKTFTRCWCCSELKKIDLSEGERLCEDCIAEIEKREKEAEKLDHDSHDEENE